jgi:hypothetical protein
MEISELFRIIKEEVQDFFSDWQTSDEPSVADKYYEKYYGIDTTNPNKEVVNVDADVVGYVTTDWGRRKLDVPIPIYKNPKTLEGIGRMTRGILLSNGDFYVAKTYYAAHEIILEILANKNIIPHNIQFDYQHELPDEYIAVQRTGESNKFVQSSAYRQFPEKYVQIFNNANRLHPYKFQAMKVVDEIESPLDPNRIQSNIPQGYDPNILYESNVKKH